MALEVEDKSMKAQLRTANRLGAAVVLIRGDQEIASGVAAVKPMDGGEQREIALAEVKDLLSQTLA